MKAFKKKNGIESRLAQAGIRMVLPSMLIIAVFTIYPIFQSLIMSFTNWNILKNTRKFVGLNNYIRMFADERFLNALKNTVEYTLLYVPLLLLLCILFAALINFRFKGASFYKSVMFVPAVTSMAIIAIIFRYILDGNIGIIPLWLKKIGVSSGRAYGNGRGHLYQPVAMDRVQHGHHPGRNQRHSGKPL